MEIIFNQDYQVRDQQKTSYKKGQRITCSEASAQHFINNGVADEFVGVPAKPQPKVAEATKSADPAKDETTQNETDTGAKNAKADTTGQKADNTKKN